MRESKILEATGQVALRRGNEFFKADYARYYSTTNWVYLKGNVEVGFLGQQQQEAQLIFRIHDRVQVMSRVRRRITEDDTTFQEESNDVQTRVELKYKMDFKGSVRDILGF